MVARKQHQCGHPAVKPTVDQFLHSIEEMNRASAEFLKIDLKTALTFTRIARETRDDIRKNRNRREARRAYDTVLKFISKIDVNDDETRVITKSLARLRLELRGLGEAL